MGYRSVLVNPDIDGPIFPIVKAATGLAKRSEAKPIGFGAADAPPPMTGPGGQARAVEALRRMRDDIDDRCKEVRGEFERLAAGTVEAELGTAVVDPTQALVNMAGIVDPQAGRPLLVLDVGMERLAGKKTVVAWKDTRVARRAAGAQPLLERETIAPDDFPPLRRMARATAVAVAAA